jgi:hypothetical protein
VEGEAVTTKFVKVVLKEHHDRWLKAVCKDGKRLYKWMERQGLWMNITTPRIRKIVDGMEANDIGMIEDAVGRQKKSPRRRT